MVGLRMEIPAVQTRGMIGLSRPACVDSHDAGKSVRDRRDGEDHEKLRRADRQ